MLLLRMIAAIISEVSNPTTDKSPLLGNYAIQSFNCFLIFMKRLIARLDTKGSRFIKGISFEGLRVLGSTVDFMSKYSQLAIDEIHLIDSVAVFIREVLW